MTTVAFKRGVLAFDSKVTAGDLIFGSTSKGKKTKKFIMAACGSVEDIAAFFDWMEAGGNQDDKRKFGLDREVDMDAIVINKKGSVTFYGSRLYPHEMHSDIFAIGSGSHLAISAMAHGASASQAVRIASKYDVNTGGTVRTLSWR